MDEAQLRLTGRLLGIAFGPLIENGFTSAGAMVMTLEVIHMRTITRSSCVQP